MTEVYVLGHNHPDTDAIGSAMSLSYLLNEIYNFKAIPVISQKPDIETRYVLDYFKIPTPAVVRTVANKQIILVDHNETAQSLADFKNSEVLAIIDHHKLEIETNKPIYLLSEPVGATATIIYFEYEELGISIPEKIAGLMLSAIISDTLLLKGPTTTKKDCVAYQDLADISGVADVDRYGAEMLKAGAVINNNTPEDFINGDVKEYFIQGKRIRIAQVYVTDMAPVLEKITDIKNEMNKHISKNYCDLFMFVMTDILKINSMIVVLGDERAIVEQAFNTKLAHDMCYQPGVVSRKKQIIPLLIKAFLAK